MVQRFPNFSLTNTSILVVKWTAVPMTLGTILFLMQNLTNELYNLLNQGYFP